MQYPIFKKGQPGSVKGGDGRCGSAPARQIPTIPRNRRDDPAGYIMSPELSDAVNVALILGVPLLVTGEPGTGKTELGRAVAHEIDAGEPLKFETKSTSQARDLFYAFDVLGRYGAQEGTGASRDPRDYITYHALGRAILCAFDRNAVSHLLSDRYEHIGPKRSVVIIDEIDKAPRDFPNDLLNEIDRMAFRVPELRYAATPGMDDPKQGIPPDLRPIVVITSNSEKGLPEPFLRRCVYHNIAFPKDPKAREEKLGEIVAARLGHLTGTCRLVGDALSLFNELRSPSEGNLLRVPPATAQLLDFLQILTALGYAESSSIRTPAVLPDLTRAIGTLVKGPEDEARAMHVLEVWCKAPSPSRP